MTGAELKAFACFADLSDEEREAFADVLQEIPLESGETVFQEGEEADGLVLVVEGRLRLQRAVPTRSGDLGPGAILGAVSLVVPGAREVTVETLDSCRVLWLPRTAFHRLVDDAPRAACRFLEHVLAELAASVRPGLSRLTSDVVDPSRPEE